MRLDEITRTNKRARRWGKQSFNYAKTLAPDNPKPKGENKKVKEWVKGCL